MMRSPSKDFLMDVEQSTSSKDALWDYGGNAFVTSEPNINSSYLINERLFHGIGRNPDPPANSAEESAPVNTAKTLLKSPCKKQTARKSVARGSQNNPANQEDQTTEIKLEPNLDDDAANSAAKVLHFFCQKCKNGIRYSPNDLQKHFLLCHNGELPLYPCEMCNFSAHDFQEFKQHRKTHRDAMVKCDICNNDNLYTLLGLTKHFSLAHCVNGHFSCSKCRFITRDVGTFVQHIHKHSGIEYACQKCNHISFSKIEFQRHLQGHSTSLPFSCQYCNYSAMRKDFIVKHILAKHREHVHTRDEQFLDGSIDHIAQTNAAMKLVLKRNSTDTQDKPLWRQEDNGSAIEKTSIEKASGFPFKSPDKDQAQKNYWANANSDQPLNDGNSPTVTTINCNKEDSPMQGNMGLLQNAVHGPTVLMVKNNKITVPANYSATFVGYKMVNGKQNLVIKLLPSNKQSTSASQPSPQSSNSLPRFSPSANHGPANSMTNSRFTPTFKPPAMQNLTTSSPETSSSLQSMTTALGSLVARKNDPVSRLGTVNRQPSFEPSHKTVQNFNTPVSTVSDVGRKIKEEPKEYNLNEQQFFDKDHSHESSRDHMHSSTASGRLTVDPTTGFLCRPRHNSESGNLSSTSLYNKDLNSSVLHSSTASGLGNYPYSTFPSKNDFGMRSAQSNERFPRPHDVNKNDNVLFMPRITSVFSLQNPSPDPKPFGKNTYLHNILQDNKRLNDKLSIAKTSSPLATSNTLRFGKQPLSSPVPRFNCRVPNGNVPSAVFLKQEPDSSGPSIRPSFPTRVNELLKTHSDSIVNQQLAKERLGAAVKHGGQPAFHLFRTPQVSGMQHGNALIYPSGTNRFTLPVLPNNQHGIRMVSPQSSAPSTVTFSTSNRLSAPVMLNTKPGMVLTIANGPFGTIRNVTNSGPQVVGTVNNLGKMALPRMQHHAVPHILKSDFNLSSQIPTNLLSSSNTGNKLPINLNVLQYCVNSDNSSSAVEGNKQPQSMQKQPLYALLPDGKQAVLLNYVLPKTASTAVNLQKTVQINQVNRKPLPKKPDEVPQSLEKLKSVNRPNPLSTTVKEEDTSSFDGYGANVPENTASKPISAQSQPAEEKALLRPNSSATSVDEPLPAADDQKMLSQPPAASSKFAKVKSKQNNLNAINSKNRSSKRRASDSSSYEADSEFRAKKRVTESLEIPRKQMLHRKCKAKSYTSEVESLPEISPPPTPPPAKDVVRTLRLFPLSSNQLVKYPVKDQPVVVLNHPDIEIPEVASIMSTISKFSGHVLRVTLSKKTIEALLESGLLSYNDGPSGRRHRRSKPISPAKDRFVLKLTLKKTSKNNYKIVKNTPPDKNQAKFNCWFCGRIFDNQDEWVGHGQRHLMEATKDWNTLF
ncbi:zinc finger protein 518A [Gastrophryne carolinensis]